MPRLPRLTLTQAKRASAIAWVVAVFFQTLAVLFPVRGLPVPLRVLIAGILVAAVVVILYTALGNRRIEKPDERAVYNSYRANSALFYCIFFLFGLFIVFGKDVEAVTLTRMQILLCFSVLCLAQDGLFLLYERFGK